MRIGHISYVYQPIIGGQEIYINNLVNYFSLLGHCQHVYQAAKPGLVEDDVLKLIPVMRGLKRKPVYLYDLLLLSKLNQLRKEDVLIVHDSIYLWPVCWHKAITVSHCVRWNRPRKSDYYYNLAHKISARFAFKFSDKFVANDSYFFREMGVNLAPREKMFQQILPKKWFIPNCVDTNFYYRQRPLDEFKEKQIIVVPRRVTPEKGIDLVVGAFAIFHQKFPDVILIICGETEDKSEYAGGVKNLVKSLGLSENVFFYGHLAREIMPAVYSSAQMTIIPTKSEEGTALAALESMSCGTATLSTNVGGLVDLPTQQCEPEERKLAKLMQECFPKREMIARDQEKQVKMVYNIDNFKKTWLGVLNKK